MRAARDVGLLLKEPSSAVDAPVPAPHRRAPVDGAVRSASWTIGGPLRVYAYSRLLVFACALFSSILLNRHPQRGPWQRYGGPHVPFVQALGRWDGAWYVNVARAGYQDVRWGDAPFASRAFFPGYPLLVRVFSTITQTSDLLAAVIVTTLLGAIAAVLAWRLVAEISGEAAARRAVTLLCFSPGAFALSMAYSEALFIVATLAALLFAVRRSWVAAGVCGAVAGFTRPNGLAVIAACAVVAAVAIARRRDWNALAAPALAAVGTTSYFVYLFGLTGDPTTWFRVERAGWGDRVAPIGALTHHVSSLFTNGVSLRSGGLNDLVWVSFAAIGVWCMLELWRWQPPLPVLAYGLAAAGLALVSYQVGLRPRMLLVAFPVVLAVGVRKTGRSYRTVLSVSVVLLIAFSTLTFASLAATP